MFFLMNIENLFVPLAGYVNEFVSIYANDAQRFVSLRTFCLIFVV